MSTLEESLKALADSNTALAKSNIALVASQDGLAVKYDSMIDAYNNFVENAGGDIVKVPVKGAEKAPEKEKPTETAAARKKREAAEAAAAAEAAKGKDGDGFDDDAGEEAAEALTADDVKKKLFAVKDANGGDKSAALEIIGKFGYAAIPEVKEKDYAKVVKACDKWLEDNE